MSPKTSEREAEDTTTLPERIVGSDGRAKVYRPLPEEARRAAREAGLSAYAEGRFFEAHELMEPAWMGSRDPAQRDLDQGLIKLAAAYVHAQRGNPLGMRKNLVGARRRLAALDGEHGAAGRRAAESAGVDAGVLLREVEAAIKRLAALTAEVGPATAGSLLSLIPPPAIPRLPSAHPARR